MTIKLCSRTITIVLLAVLIAIILYLVVTKYFGHLELFTVDPPYPAYINDNLGTYPYSGGPYYHDAPNWFDLWSARFNLWRSGQYHDKNYDNHLANIDAQVPLPPAQIKINGNRREMFDGNVARPYYDNVTSIYSTMDLPASQKYDWDNFKLSGIPANNAVSLYKTLDTPADQSYDWSKFVNGNVPVNTTRSIMPDLIHA